MRQLTVRGNTDTAHAQAVVPIYLVHTLDQLFCPFPDCECHTNQPEITHLLEQINNGLLILRDAASFVERVSSEEKTSDE